MQLFFLLLAFIGIAAGLAWFLIGHDHGEKEPVAALWMAAGLGLVGGFGAGYLEGHIIPVHNLSPGSASLTLLGASLTVGVIEEACKFLPLALLIYKRRFFNEHTDGVIYFALAGLGFGLPENILYTLQFGAKTGLIRIFLTPFFHAATTGIVGYFLIKRKLAGRSPWLTAVPLGGVMLLHGFYDYGLMSGSAINAAGSLAITLGLSIGLFVLFLRAGDRDQDKGLSAVGHNQFCRSCGWPNPKRHLYCVHCGKNA